MSVLLIFDSCFKNPVLLWCQYIQTCITNQIYIVIYSTIYISLTDFIQGIYSFYSTILFHLLDYTLREKVIEFIQLIVIYIHSPISLSYFAVLFRCPISLSYFGDLFRGREFV